MVAAEEQHRHINNTRQPRVDTSAFQVQAGRKQREDRDDHERDRVRCTHCNRLCHTKEVCYRLVGFSSGHPRARSNDEKTGSYGGKKPKAAHVEQDASSPLLLGFTAAQLAQLRELLTVTSPDAPTTPTTHMAGLTFQDADWSV
ncbi:unnamed protein product [Linum trigynum]|uniref:Uncharacterized protein n=1 Tax=Linum trigynum TaxID=586398 RepID=A0AAV2E9P4_9ROSI